MRGRGAITRIARRLLNKRHKKTQPKPGFLASETVAVSGGLLICCLGC
ncbi:hypothetical protein EJP617_13060 [Erwinia sp. Ejp617]|nr:hypothetical protein EJP617_13060 [Erwinia sp. Ejp617]